MTEEESTRRLVAAQSIVREAGQLALSFFRRRERLVVETKGPAALVSEADRAVEAAVKRRLRGLYPHDAFLGEEGGLEAGRAPDAPIWVVDPIDGTDCFVNGIPVWCVSIALVVHGEIELGVIYDPNAHELFATRRGVGADMNGQPIGPSAADSLSAGLVGVGFSHRRAPEPTLAMLSRLLAEGGMYQRNGSGALMLAYVASGRYIGYYEAHINAWDALAGIALVRAAGGWTNDFLAGDGLYEGNEIVACGPQLVRPMRAACGLEPSRIRNPNVV